jgi:hypothetical protein
LVVAAVVASLARRFEPERNDRVFATAPESQCVHLDLGLAQQAISGVVVTNPVRAIEYCCPNLLPLPA